MGTPKKLYLPSNNMKTTINNPNFIGASPKTIQTNPCGLSLRNQHNQHSSHIRRGSTRDPPLLGDAEFIRIGKGHLEEERKVQETLQRIRPGDSWDFCNMMPHD